MQTSARVVIFVTKRFPNMQHLRRDVYQAIADPTRREIIDLLASRPLNLNAIADNFAISRPAVSKHIRILTECGLITIHEQGRERICRADLHKLREVSDWTEKYKVFWLEKLDKLEIFLSKPKGISKVKVKSKN